MSKTNHVPLSPQSLQHQFAELQERATKDALSGILNRATAELYINQRLCQMAPEELCALFIIDLDNFKVVNDTLGHQAGDQAIRLAAQILSGLFRATDIVGRLGGDEFIVFLYGRITEKLVRRKGNELCQKLQLALGNNPVITVTASVGIYLSSKAQNFEQIYQPADLALYKAKKNGKHGFFLKHSDSLPEPGRDDFRSIHTIPLSGLLEHMDSGVALLEMGEFIRLIYASPSFCRLIGVDPQSYVLPHPLSQIIHPDDLIDLEHTLRQEISQEGSVEHTARVSADGKNWFWWHIRATRIEYNNPHPVLLATTTDISCFKESEERLQQLNQRLQSALEQTAQGIWEVDMTTNTFSIFSYVHGHHLSESMHGTFPEFLLSNGWVHPNSISRFREFSQELLQGQMQGYGNFVTQFQDTGCYGWAALSYRMLCDELGRAVKAVGIIENLPKNLNGQESRPLFRRPIPESLTPYLIVGLHANLSQDTVQELWVEGKNLTGRVGKECCSAILRREGEKLFSADDRQTLAGYFDREELLRIFARGERWLSIEYRRIDGSGSIRWVSHVVNFGEDPITREIHLFSYLTQVDRRRQLEVALGIDIVRDRVTGLYDRATTRALVEFRLGKGRFRECAIAVILLGGLERLYAENVDEMNRRRYYVTAALSVALGPECTLGQYSRDQLLVFFPEITSKSGVKRRLEDAFAFIRLALADMPALGSLRFVAGTVCARQEGAGYLNMSAQAVQLCQLWHNAAADTVVFPQEGEEWAWDELQRTDREDMVTVHQAEMERPLSDSEKDVAFQCISSMLVSDSLDSSIRSVLNAIGQYYMADRVYVLTLAENRYVVTMPYEWTSQHKPSIQQVVSGQLVEHFPLVKQCMEEKAPVFLARSHRLFHRSAAPNEAWHFTVFPLMENSVVEGFLCIENSREHPADAALFTTLIPYILREQKRFHTKMQMPGESSGNFLSGLPNLRSYMNVIYSLNSDVYSTLGAVCLDVPRLSTINSSQGFEYGSKLLWYVSKTLADIFGHSFLFRTWDAEFVALCPDTTREVFVGRCTRLRSVLQRRYPKDVRMGYTWSDGIFTGKALVNEARSIMNCEQVTGGAEAGSKPLGCGLHSVNEAVRLGRFTVYFQPKIHMITGALMGAEALVRGVDEHGGLISPGRFVGELEKNGDIRDLDLYVFNHTLSCMDRWRELGYRQVPISVNCSRRTLFEPATLASVLAIQSRYPLLPPEQLVLEITESAGQVENSTLTEQLDRYRELGVRFALDDFGSQYANISVFTNVKFDEVKLDRSLISQLSNNPKGRMLVRDLVDICRSAGMNCVAEGVENQAQVAALTEAGCICAQGYYYDRPLPAERFEEKYLRPAQTSSAL